MCRPLKGAEVLLVGAARKRGRAGTRQTSSVVYVAAAEPPAKGPSGAMRCLACCGGGMTVMEGHVGTQVNLCPGSRLPGTTGKCGRSWDGLSTDTASTLSPPLVTLTALMEAEGTALVSLLRHCQESSTGDVPGQLQTLGAALTQAAKSQFTFQTGLCPPQYLQPTSAGDRQDASPCHQALH